MELYELTIKEATEGLSLKKFSSVELTTACLNQIKKHDKDLNAFITVCEDKALDAAKKADELINQESDLSLLGIPIALKDLFSTKGIRTTAGSKIIENYIPPFDATVVRKLKNAGAIIVGKTNQDAWGHGSSGENSDFGPTKNPYDLSRVPGGSSSGSAVAVATGESLMATGTDTGSSVRLPAAFCNVVGLKPTYGRVSRYGIIAMASSFDTIGHITKTVYDNALVLETTAGKDIFDATTATREAPKYTKSLGKNIEGLTIGIPKEYFVDEMEKSVKDTISASIKTMEKLGVKIKQISLPYTEYAMACYYILVPSEISSNLARYDGIRYGGERKMFGDEAKRRIMLGTYTLSSGYYDAYYLKAAKVRNLIKQDFENAFKEVDLIIAPSSPTLPWKIGEKANDPLKMYLSDIFMCPINIAGVPSLNIPCGFVDNLPLGMQIIGPQFSEELLFQAGHAYEQETMFYKQKPNL